MKQVTAILLVLGLLLQCGARFGVLGLYQLNRGYIATNLCEERADRTSTCHGKCYLRKQLDKVDKDEHPAKHAFKKHIEETVLFFEPKRSSTPRLASLPSVPRRTPVLQHLHDMRVGDDIFHPPAPTA